MHASKAQLRTEFIQWAQAMQRAGMVEPGFTLRMQQVNKAKGSSATYRIVIVNNQTLSTREYLPDLPPMTMRELQLSFMVARMTVTPVEKQRDRLLDREYSRNYQSRREANDPDPIIR